MEARVRRKQSARAKALSIKRDRYMTQRRNAMNRGIAFQLTFEEWWNIWRKSGRWHQRGNKGGQYQMARFADKGAYEVGNVRIVTMEENVVEALTKERR